MCQLLALSANSPTDISFSFEGFVHRAGITDTNVDGTGIAFFEAPGIVCVLKDENRAVDSYVRNLVRVYQTKAHHIIAHIRRASQGNQSLANTHPFVREIWGESWVFAHNGHLRKFPHDHENAICVGETDSEKFFAILACHLEQNFPTKPSDEEIFSFLSSFVDDFAQAGTLNFVLSNGSMLLAHCSTNLWWVTRSAANDAVVQRVDDGGVINLSAYAQPNDICSLVCTMPVTNEKWNKLENGQLVMFKNGQLKFTYNGVPSVIDARYEALTGLSPATQAKIVAEQAAYTPKPM